MAQNYATKYQSKIAERFSIGSVTNSAAGNEYSFVGAKTIVVQSVDVVELNNFQRNAASNRFGAVANLGNTKQELTMTQDKSFVFAIDAGDASDTAIEMSAGKALRREIDEVVVPTLDKYRLAAWANGGTEYTISSALDPDSIYEEILLAGAEMTDALVPLTNRTIYVPTKNFVLLKQNTSFVGVESLGKEILSKGALGMVDGAVVKSVPSSWLPEGVEFIIKYKGTTVDPVKLQNYYIRKDAQGFDGPVVEGRVYFDSFVLDTKKAGIVVGKISDEI